MQRSASLLLEEMLQTGQLELQLLHQNGRQSLQLSLVLQRLKQLLDLLALPLVLKPDLSMELVALSQILF